MSDDDKEFLDFLELLWRVMNERMRYGEESEAIRAKLFSLRHGFELERDAGIDSLFGLDVIAGIAKIEGFDRASMPMLLDGTVGAIYEVYRAMKAAR